MKEAAIINAPGRWDVFISHTQRNANAKLLALDLYGSLKERGITAWLDVKMKNRDEAAMREGVRNSTICVAIISDGDGTDGTAYFMRPFCLSELRWAVEANVFIQPVIDIDDKKRIGEFMQQAPEDLKFLGGINFLELYRGSLDFWDTSVNGVVGVLNDKKVPNANLIEEYAEIVNAMQSSKDVVEEKKDRMQELKAQLANFTISQADVTMDTLVGEGGFGNVHRGVLRKGASVAVKVLHAHRLNRPSIKAMLREAHILSQLKHPNIMVFFGAIVEPPTYGYVMQYYPNGCVSDQLTDTDMDISWERRIRWGVGLASGLEYLHARKPSPIVHGDVKAANLLLDCNDNAVLIDFGLATIRKQHASSTANVQGGSTIRWAAPECNEGERKTPASDMFSFAITMWEMATRESLPMADMHDVAYMRYVAEGKRPPLPADTDACPQDFRELIEACWQAKPEKRATAEDALDRLQCISL